MTKLDEIKSRLESASPGPWVIIESTGDIFTPERDVLATVYDNPGEEVAISNQQLIGHAPEDISWLIGEVERLTAEKAELKAPWGPDDKPLPEDAAIEKAHPMETDRHDLYQEAMRLVGAKFSKRGLVALVNWLLSDKDRLTAQVADLESKLSGKVEFWTKQYEGMTREQLVSECISRAINRDAQEQKIANLTAQVEKAKETLIQIEGVLAYGSETFNDSRFTDRHGMGTAFTKAYNKVWGTISALKKETNEQT